MALEQEADLLCRALFGRSPGPEVVELYVRANRSLFTPAELVRKTGGVMSTVVERGLDIEAIELALRRRSPKNPITQKAHVMCYIAEVHRPFYASFHNDTPSMVAGYFTLAAHTCRTLWKWLKGRYLLWRHGIA